jgi:hypothetical protein
MDDGQFVRITEAGTSHSCPNLRGRLGGRPQWMVPKKQIYEDNTFNPRYQDIPSAVLGTLFF